MTEKVIIIGSGPAGLSAAIYASREGFEPLLIASTRGGGQLELTSVVENIPGFPNGVDGPEFVQLMKKQAEKFGTRFLYEDVSSISFESRPFTVSAGGKEYLTDSVIIATGANAKWLGIPSEQRLIGKGVSSCATCDGAFFKNKNVIVVGGGDTAMEDSLFLTRFANSVTIVHRRDSFRASKIMQERVLSNPKIKVIWSSTIDEILGAERVTGARIRDLVDGKVTEMPIDGVFVAIGYAPNTQMLNGKLKLDDQGYVITQEEVKTEIEGVYIAGDVADRFYRQAATAAGSGIKCALHVREYLSRLEYERNKEKR